MPCFDVPLRLPCCNFKYYIDIPAFLNDISSIQILTLTGQCQ